MKNKNLTASIAVATAAALMLAGFSVGIMIYTSLKGVCIL